MKTLYYKIKIREPRKFVNEGFVRVKIGKESKITLYGILTDDLFIGKERDERIQFSYLTRNHKESRFDETFIFAMQVEDFWKLLENFQLPKRFELEYEDGTKIIFTIYHKIKDRLKKEEYNRRINEMINVFENESQ